MTQTHRETALRLLERCNRHEGLDLPISFGQESNNSGVVTEFAALDDDRLLGFASMPEDVQPEACLLVHPDARRHGIGRSLLDAIRAEVARRGLDECVLVNDDASLSGRQFLVACGVPFESAEYRLELDRDRIGRTKARTNSLRLRQAGAGDRESLIKIRASGFGDSPEETAPGIDHGLNEQKRHFYLAELDGLPIGIIRAGEWDGNGDLTSFAVLPEFRGRGFGRQILLDAVELLIAAGWERILIEVATDNENALGLYQSCGFRVTTKYGFYRLIVNPMPG